MEVLNDRKRLRGHSTEEHEELQIANKIRRTDGSETSHMAKNDSADSKTTLYRKVLHAMRNYNEIPVTKTGTQTNVCELCNLFEFIKETPKEGASSDSCHKESSEYLLVIIVKLLSSTNRSYLKCRNWRRIVDDLDTLPCLNILKSYELEDTDPDVTNSRIFLLKVLLWQWKGWEETKIDSIREIEATFKNLNEYVSENVKKTIVTSTFSNAIDTAGNAVYVECSLKLLKSLFSGNANYGNFIDDILTYEVDQNFRRDFLQYGTIVNWPFVSIRLSLPDIILYRCNNNHNEMRFVNMKSADNKFTVKNDMSTNLYYKPKGIIPPSSVKSCYPSDITVFIQKILSVYKNKAPKYITHKIKDTIAFLNEFMKDLDLVTDTLDIAVEYYANLFQYPYRQYISRMEDVADEYGEEYDIALEQIVYPSCKFSVWKMSPMLNFTSATTDLAGYSLAFKCDLCDKEFASSSSSMDVRLHILHNHSYELEYACCKCDKTISSIKLSMDRWHHECNQQVN